MEFDIVLQLVAPPSVSRNDLEHHMEEVLEVLERHAQGVALGPVVSVDFARHLIDVGFNVEAQSPALSQSVVGDVLKLVEQHAGLPFSQSDVASRRAGSNLPEELCVA